MKILHGIDITSVKRIEKTISRQKKPLLNRIYTPAEQQYCSQRAKSFEHYAARFAAKEAFIKALELEAKDGVSLSDIEVRKKPSGKPYIFLSPKLLKKTGLKKNTQVELSLTHEREYAVASVIIVQV